jgi:hypothetical protein
VKGALVVGVVDPAGWALEHPASMAKTVTSEMSNNELAFITFLPYTFIKLCLNIIAHKIESCNMVFFQ